MIDNDVIELDFEQMDRDLQHLSHVQKQEVLAAEAFGDFPPETTAKYAYLTEKMDEGRNVKSVPAGVIASLLGYAYSTRRNRADFKNIIEKHPDFVGHWVVQKKSTVRENFSQCGDNIDIEFPIPGKETTYVISASDDVRTEYVFMTPVFARFLLSCADDRLHAFFHKVHDEVRKMVKGEESIFGRPATTAMEVEAAPAIAELCDDEKRIKTERADFELFKEKMLFKKSMMDWSKDYQKDAIQHQIETYEKLGGLDDVTRVFLRDQLRNEATIFSFGHGGNLLLDTENPKIIEISTELRKMGRSHRGEDVQAIGRILSKLYKEKHGRLAPQVKKFCNGAMRDIRVYYEEDLPLMHEAINIYYADADAEAAKKAETEAAGKLFAFGFGNKRT